MYTQIYNDGNRKKPMAARSLQQGCPMRYAFCFFSLKNERSWDTAMSCHVAKGIGNGTPHSRVAL